MTAAVYTRISRDDFDDGLGVARQEIDCRALAVRRGQTVQRVYSDNDISAFTGRRRPAYAELCDAIQNRTVSHVFAWAPERLHRSPRELEDFLELIDRTGVIVETVKAGTWDVSTSHGRLVARMLGAVSRAESERTGERISRAHQQAKAMGRWRGPIPFGMQPSDSPGLPEPDPEQAPLVTDIYQRVLRGDALGRIAADLNRAGQRPRRGKEWTHTGVLRLVASPALGGLVDVDGELRPAAFTGVVDAGTWQQAQTAIKNRPRGETRRPREKLTLLGGILTCAEHGHVCFGGSAEHSPVYVANGPGRCYVSITRAAADELVTAVVINRLSRPDARQLFEPAADPAVDEERQALRQRRDGITQLLGEGLVQPTAARPQLVAIADRLAELEQHTALPAVDDDLLQQPPETWNRLTQPQRRAVLRVLFDKITVRHGGQAGGPRADPTRMSVIWHDATTNP